VWSYGSACSSTAKWRFWRDLSQDRQDCQFCVGPAVQTLVSDERGLAMRIAHICLANFYIDGFGYQENILTSMHSRMGHQVLIVASTETYIGRTRLGYVEPGAYINEDGIEVRRLPYSALVPRRLQTKVRAYEGLEDLLEGFRPELIFVHDVQFWDFLTIRRYVRKRPTPVYADCHTDFVNSARGWLSRYLLHGVFYRWILAQVDPVVQRYFPTLPARADFLHEVYGLDRKKMELLPFGVDDTRTAGLDRAAVRAETRGALGIPPSATVFVTGGKLDLRKNIHVAIERFSALKRNGELGDARLLVFGQPSPEVQAILSLTEIHPHVHMMGWLPANQIYRMFWAADLAVFPGTHSVLWEEAIGHGLGAVLHHWEGMGHLDLGGNVRVIVDAAPETLDALFRGLLANDADEVRRLGAAARIAGPAAFAFSAIAARSIAAIQTVTEGEPNEHSRH
jgi:1,2-diacylglycerol 3-alpha-glucosyltransferase